MQVSMNEMVEHGVTQSRRIYLNLPHSFYSNLFHTIKIAVLCSDTPLYDQNTFCGIFSYALMKNLLIRSLRNPTRESSGSLDRIISKQSSAACCNTHKLGSTTSYSLVSCIRPGFSLSFSSLFAFTRFLKAYLSEGVMACGMPKSGKLSTFNQELLGGLHRYLLCL